MYGQNVHGNRFRRCIISRKNIARKPVALILFRSTVLQQRRTKLTTSFFLFSFYKTHSYLADDTERQPDATQRADKFQCTRTALAHLRNAFYQRRVIVERRGFSSRRNVPGLRRNRTDLFPLSFLFFFLPTIGPA